MSTSDSVDLKWGSQHEYETNNAVRAIRGLTERRASSIIGELVAQGLISGAAGQAAMLHCGWAQDVEVARLHPGHYGKVTLSDVLRVEEEPYVAPDFFCPQCNKQAAPEHVSVFCEQRTGSYGEIEVANGHKCKCWWCQTEWEEA